MSDESPGGIIDMQDVTVVALRDVTRVVLEEVNWSVAAGDFWVIGGLQQSGKSDLLMTAAGLLSPWEGELRLFGQNPKMFEEADLAIRLRLGVVFDGGQLFNALTIAENIALPLRYHKNLAPGEATQLVSTLLEVMELQPLADVTPGNVTASWRQRAALARALIMKPEVLLLDNPLRAVGGRHSEWWINFFEQLRRGHTWYNERPITIVATTEDLRLWRGENRKFALLHDKQFLRVGSWNEVETSADPVMKELLVTSAGPTI